MINKKSFARYFSLSFLMIILFVVSIICFSDNMANREDDINYVDVPVLMYHHMTVTPSKVSKYVILVSDFEKDIQWLKNNQYTAISTDELINYCYGEGSLPPKPVMITFDDGYESVYVYGDPLLEKYDMKAVVSIIGTYSEQFSNTEYKHISYSHLTWDEIKDMSQNGRWSIENHTYDMHDLKKARKGIKKLRSESIEQYRTALAKDVEKTQSKVKEVTGREPVLFAYPFGSTCKESDEVLKSLGIKITLTSEEGENCITKGSDLFMMKRYNRSGKISTKCFMEHALK